MSAAGSAAGSAVETTGTLAAANQEAPVRFDEAKLANGLRVIGEYNPGAASVAAGYFVQTGARDETAEVSGVSHFLEHMVFKGNDEYSADDINRMFDELGAQYNAYTSEERTVYYGAVLPDRLPELVNLLSQLMRPVLRSADFEVEKKVILEEIAMYEDRPHFHVFDISTAKYWNGHPLGNSVLGSAQSITDLQRDQMMGYFEKRYAPGNLVLAVAGNYDWHSLLAQVEQITSTWPSFPVERLRPAATPATGRLGTLDEKLSRIYVAFYAPGVSLADPRRYAAAVLASTLGDDDGSRLYWELVDKGIADNAGLDHDAAEDQGAFSGYVSTAPERAEQVIGKYLEILGKAQDEPPTPDEWRRAQRKIATGLTLRAETPLGRLNSLGTGYQSVGEYRSVQEVVERILAADLETGKELLAARPFDQSFVYTLGPK